MRIDGAFPSDYLKSSDIEGQQVIYTIKSVAIEEIGQERDQRPVVYFDETDKGLVLNKTNSRTISDEYGLETDDWVGRQIALYEKMVEFSGKEVPAIRIKMPRAKPVVRKPAGSAKFEDPVSGDKIPF
jgi:hypothetical protein